MRTWLRVWALAEKELLHVQRDPRTLYLALGMPVVMLLAFGYGVTFDVDEIPVVVVDRDRTAASRRFRRELAASGEIDVVADPDDEAAALARMRVGAVSGVVVLPRGYGADRARGLPVTLQLLTDGVEGTVATQTQAKVSAIASALGNGSVFGAPPRPTDPAPYAVRISTFFNPAGESVYYIVPGITAYVVAIVAVMLTALTVAREWEQGSMEQLFATPVSRLEIILGKLLPYLGLGLVASLLVLAVGMWVFGMPFRGDPATLFLATVLFVTGMLGQGLLISTIARDQLVATQVAAFSSLLPSILLSGFIFPIANMPTVIRWLTTIVPARYFIDVLRGVLLRGNGPAELGLPLLGLVLFALAMLAIATARFRREVA
ncbi:MAG TPA: ABC transporter permease [Polyangiaceae bacterium LLY-WYZ-14_1]|nr:ABC transporter permease [Polyangiaceae bacterium LLY-WYZ-14_1]